MKKRLLWALPVALLASAFVGYSAMSQRAEKDIVDTAVGAGQFKTLVKLVQEAGLVDALRGEGPFTVFAPTDEAFAKLPKSQVDALLKDKEALRRVLLYHVVQGKVMASDVTKMRSAKTLQGQNINIRVRNNTVRINDAKVVKADIVCSNGVIHVIDKVILPPNRR
ncbi:MAG: fasciclin domain-containing protein [Armatimonadetes bacterium]|nr:fasciclin domain-containing protein [Armatimonadota bacterium]